MPRKKKKSRSNSTNIAYKYRCYPTDEQTDLFVRTFGCCRWIWNNLLADCNNYYYSQQEFLIREVSYYKPSNPWLCEVDSLALANTKNDLETTFNRFFSHKGGFPKFKAKHFTRKSYTTNNQNGTIRFEREELVEGKYRFLIIPKASEPLKIRYHRNLPNGAVIRHITISQESDGNWYVSILADVPVASLKAKKKSRLSKEKVIGLDYKSDGLFVDSNGGFAGMPKFYRKSHERLAKEQRKLSRMREANVKKYIPSPNGKGMIPVYYRPLEECRNYQKQKAKVAKLHAKVRNQRKDYLEKMSTKLAEEYDVIGLEGMNMKNIARSLNLGKATLDNGFGFFRTRLEQKMNQRGKKLVRADQKFPSSQLCNVCGCKNPAVKDLKIRAWKCPDCGQNHDRDINAACNLRDYAFREVFGSGKGKRFAEPTETVKVYPAP